MSTQSKPVYANFSVYKGKAALSLRVCPPHALLSPWKNTNGRMHWLTRLLITFLQVRKPRWSILNDGGFTLER